MACRQNVLFQLHRSFHISPSPQPQPQPLFFLPDLPAALSDVSLTNIRKIRFMHGGIHCSINNPTTKPITQVVYVEVSDFERDGSDVNSQKILSTCAKFTERKQSDYELGEAFQIKKRVDKIKEMLSSMEDGETSISGYDTAWVSLVKDTHGSGAPQFPSSLQWIVKNQLDDGSWGDSHIYLAYDRLINTLACVIALKSWNLCPERCENGMLFMWKNICKLDYENTEHMPIGFEIIFPSLIDYAKRLGLEIPTSSPALQGIYADRNLKLSRIPKDTLHNVPTSLLYCLEGMKNLDWDKLLRLKWSDGSFLCSPSSTAFAFMHTKDENCLRYLNQITERFNGGAPSTYPVDLFEHIWAVDRLERLGISRYFQPEIKECIAYIYKYWTEEGICWARNSKFCDIDDTAMGFRLLRLHGHNISSDVFRHFQKGGEFFCFYGQSNQALTGTFNLYRASQVSFRGERVLDEAKTFSHKYLRQKQASKNLVDKWIITKDLASEVGYVLETLWYASLPRIEAKFYIEHYGGEDDVWIGKTLYRMHYVNNNVYLELAKLDFNNCQALHQLEWNDILKWFNEYNLQELGVSMITLQQSYFLAMASIFEPETAIGRLAWAKTAVLVEAISLYFQRSSIQQIRSFVLDFTNNTNNKIPNDKRNFNSKNMKDCIIETLIDMINLLSSNVYVAHSKDVRHNLMNSWERWMMTWDLNEVQYNHQEAELFVRTLTLCNGVLDPIYLLSHPKFEQLVRITNKVCHQLSLIQRMKVGGTNFSTLKFDDTSIISLECGLKELAECVLIQNSDDLDRQTKQIFLTVAKRFYYTAHYTPATINLHISKVLFENVA